MADTTYHGEIYHKIYAGGSPIEEQVKYLASFNERNILHAKTEQEVLKYLASFNERRRKKELLQRLSRLKRELEINEAHIIEIEIAEMLEEIR